MPSDLPNPPKAETHRIEELVSDARRGRIRVPHFQRGLKWDAGDVASLFDSVLRGYPVGSLLLWRRGATGEGPTRFGPVEIPTPDPRDVRWLVDGQQRVTALVAALTARVAPDDTFDLWFDPDDMRFHSTRAQGPDPRWVEVWRLLDAAELGEYLHEWTPGRDNRERRKALLEAGKRIREYPVPAYVIETDDEGALREIFKRTNRQGKQLLETDIFDALVVGTDRTESLEALSETLRGGGFGRIDEKTLLRAILGVMGGDPTRRLDQQRTEVGVEPEDLRAGIAAVSGPMQSALALLQRDAGIPHRDLLPYATPLVVLPAFFARHPDPDARVRRALVRWVWRGFATGAHERQGPLRQGLAAARRDGPPEACVRAMLETVPNRPIAWSAAGAPYRGDSAHARIGMLALASLEPLHLTSREPVDVRACIEAGRFGCKVHSGQAADGGTLHETVANWLVHPSSWQSPSGANARTARAALRGLADDETAIEVLRSHAIDPDATRALKRDELGVFLALRAAAIERVVADRIEAHADWGASDRPNLREVAAGAPA